MIGQKSHGPSATQMTGLDQQTVIEQGAWTTIPPPFRRTHIYDPLRRFDLAARTTVEQLIPVKVARGALLDKTRYLDDDWPAHWT